MNPLDKAIQLGGGLSEFSKKIGAKPNQVNNWRKRGVPTDFCARVETAVGGEVTRKELRPDDWQEIWPELDAQSEKKTAATGAAEESNEELRREVDLGCRQPADPKKVSQ